MLMGLESVDEPTGTGWHHEFAVDHLHRHFPARSALRGSTCPLTEVSGLRQIASGLLNKPPPSDDIKQLLWALVRACVGFNGDHVTRVR
jgi:hypothetical protein